ncbi:MAG: DUF4465 domain-containing protein [Muribaculaceae bacterium]|nr:DUF4465 domain-containing protein [Muribaculaceae bacterium]
MKKIFTLAVSALMASAAWAGVITLDLNKPLNPTSLEYNEYGIWTNCYDDVNYTWLEFGDENGEFMLSHLIDGEGASWGGYYWDGFCPAIGGDQTDYGQPGSSGTWTTYFGGCMAGGGCVINEDGTVTADPSQPYLVGYYSSWAYEGPSNQVMFVGKDRQTTFEPVGVYVCNHPWPYYGCEHGDGFGAPFAEGDYFELIAHGVAADGSETTVSINLVDFTNGELHALNDWTFFDLSSLGEVESVYFTMNSTDTGDYGMNTAAYFCMDKFQVKGEDDPAYTPVAPKVTIVTNSDDVVVGGIIEGAAADHATVALYRIDEEGEYHEIANPESFARESEDYKVTIVAIATYDNGVIMSSEAVEVTVTKKQTPTGIDEMMGGKTVAGVRYFNMAGQEMQQAEGLTIVVTTYTDGTTSAVKVIK